MVHLEVSCAVRRLYRSLGIKGLINICLKRYHIIKMHVVYLHYINA